MNDAPIEVVACGRQWGVIDYDVLISGRLKPVWGWYTVYRDAAEVEKVRPYYDQARSD